MTATANSQIWNPNPYQESEPISRGFLTREELAEVLKVSLRTVDRMLANGEITPVRVRTTLVRFYLPDVVRQLVATALTRKNGRRADGEELKAETRGTEGRERSQTV